MVLSRLAKLLLLYQVNILYCTYYVTLLIVYIAIGFNVETVEVAMDAPLDSSNEPSLIVQKYQIPSVGPRWTVEYTVCESSLAFVPCFNLVIDLTGAVTSPTRRPSST